MKSISIKRILNATLALGVAASAFTVLPATDAFAQTRSPYNGIANDRQTQREDARKATSQVPNYQTKSHTEFVYDLRPYIKNADQYTVIVRGLPQGVKYDIDSRTISGSTPFTGNYSVTVSLKGYRRDKHLQTFKLKVDSSYGDPNGYPRNTDDPNLNRQPHTRR